MRRFLGAFVTFVAIIFTMSLAVMLPRSAQAAHRQHSHHRLFASVGSQNVETAPPGAPYKKVSELVKLPDFIPGIGTLYVDPKTLPEGPFLAYDHKGHLVSTIYMIPLKGLDAQKVWSNLAAPGGKVDHVSIDYNAGHPGVPEPHYHIVLWHVSKAAEQLVAK